LALSFLYEKPIGKIYLLWLQALIQRFIYTNEERSSRQQARRYPKMSTPSVIIRPVRREDATDLQINCFSQNRLIEVQQQIEGLLADFARGQALRLVAEVDGSVFGSADLLHETHRLKRHRATWGGVVVCGNFQGIGIARALLQETLTQAATWDIKLLTVGVRGGTSAEGVYRRLGFLEYARLPAGFKEEREGSLLVCDDVCHYLPVPALADRPRPT
jgi:GNAT superfamily N-acetyltransferase